MKQRTISIQLLSIIAVVALIVLILPLLFTSIYNRPVADDLVQPYPAAVAYRESGSFFTAFSAAVQETINIWNMRSGIFSSMFLSVFAPYIFNYTYGFFHPLLVIVLLVIASFHTSKCLLVINPALPRSYVRFFGAMLSIALITTMPDVSENIFWYSGAVNYTLFFAISLLLFASLFQTLAAKDLPLWKSILLLIVYSIGFFFLGGANWMTPTLSIVVYGFLALYIFLKKKPVRYLIPFLFLLFGYLLAIAAPGNANRQAVVGERLPLIDAFLSAFVNGIQTCTANGIYYLLPLLLLPVFARLSQYMPKLPKLWFLAPVGSLCILAAAFFPLVFSSYPILDRHHNMLFLHFTVLLLINEALLVMWLTQRLSAVYQKGDTFSLKKTVVYVLVAALLFAGAFNTSIGLSPFRVSSDYAPLKAVIHLVQGHSKNYAQYYDDLVYTLQNTEETDIIATTDFRSPLLGNPGIHWDPTYWTNQGFVTFYTDRAVNMTVK